MKKWLRIFSVYVFVGILCGCSLENRLQQKQENAVSESRKVAATDGDFELVEKITWQEPEKCSIETTLFNANAPLKDLAVDKPKYKLEIKELSSGKMLLSRDGSESPLWIQVTERVDDKGRLLLASYAAGSANVLKGYLVTCSTATEIFSEAYRDFYWNVQFYENEKTKLLIFTADNLTEFDNRLMVKKWEWDGKVFRGAGVATYADFISNLGPTKLFRERTERNEE